MSNVFTQPITRKQVFTALVVLYMGAMLAFAFYAYFLTGPVPVGYKGLHISSASGIWGLVGAAAPGLKKIWDRITSTDSTTHELQQKLTRTEAALHDLQGRFSVLENKYEVEAANSGAMFRENKDLRNSNNDLLLENGDLKKDNASLQTKNRTLSADNRRLKKQVEELETPA